MFLGKKQLGNMENTDSFKSATGSHPLVTMLFFGAMVAGLVGAGSYVSKQRSMARTIEAEVAAPITFFKTQP